MSQNQNHPKGITNSWFKLPKFQTSSTHTWGGPQPKFMSNQAKPTPNLISSQGTGPQTRKKLKFRQNKYQLQINKKYDKNRYYDQ